MKQRRRIPLPAATAAAVLLIGMLGIMSACSTVPGSAQPAPAAAENGAAAQSVPDPGFERRSPAVSPITPGHEPFVKLVDLKRLRVGMTKAQVRAIFPDPEEIDISPAENEVWKYGFAQLHFRDGRLADWFKTPSSRNSRSSR